MASDPSTRTVYLLHGLLCDARVWAHQREALEAAGLDARVPDLRGVDSLAEIAARVLDEAPYRFCLAGHSMGGRVALEVVRRAPDRVSALALLDTAAHPVREGEAGKRQELLELAHREGMAAMGRQWAPPMVHADRLGDRALMDEILDMVASYSYEDYRKQVAALLGRDDQVSVLETVRGPTLVLCGREDVWSPVQQHEEMLVRLPPSARFVVVERCGHMSTMEQPEAVSGALLEWLEPDAG